MKLVTITFALLCAASASSQTTSSSFKGRVVAEWIVEPGEDRKMVLLEDFEYVDAKGTVWKAPKGWPIDGASIPPFFWTMIGSPYTGDYRRASVVHDYYCDKKIRPWRDVHRMFYEASLSDGVSLIKAKVMYAAVYEKGPRWTLVSGNGLQDPDAQIVEYTPAFAPHDQASLEDWVKRENPPLNDIEKRIDALQLE